jgi:lambda family phage portal protein
MRDARELAVSWWDRFLIGVAPEYGLRRVRARASAQLMARHFEAAQGGRRTSGWSRTSSDANVANGPALTALRELSRDLRRNNGWAKRGVQVIANNTVGWGIRPKASGGTAAQNKQALAAWHAWARETACDFDGRMNFYGLQHLAMETIVESGEVLIVRQPAATVDGLAIPLRLQVLEPDYLDTSRNGIAVAGGGQIIDGVEFDQQGRRVAYWLFTSHPGGQRLMTTKFESVRTPADRVLHVYQVERAGQVRGVPWLSSAITRIKDLDDFEDAELMQQKVAACFGAFVTDMDGGAGGLGQPGTDTDGQRIDHLEPGHIEYLPPGKSVTFAQPPRTQDSAFTTRVLRRVAVSLSVPYEELSGDYSQVNYSSARMARIAHWASVEGWREHMLIPQLCAGVWRWAMQLAKEIGGWPTVPTAEWSSPPMPILEPDKEGLAFQRLVRIGAMTWPQMIRELGQDPTAQLEEIELLNKELDDRGIVLDCDPRHTTAGGQQQGAVAGKSTPGGKPRPDHAEDDASAAAASDGAPDDAPADQDSKNDDGGANASAADKEPTVDQKKRPAESPPAQPVEAKVFAYHQPFMKVSEIREGIALPGDVADGNLFALEFLAKHGGASGSNGGGTTSAP